MVVFCFPVPFSLVEVYRRFRRYPDDALMMEAESTSYMSVNFYQTKRYNNPEYSHIDFSVFTYHWFGASRS
jgi:hypothetical protein